tara:strand:- start:1156 stop:1665 length:510 start_codon:yes stop_codon:yes gene_type:complete
MVFDATFWVAISFIIFIGILLYFKIPQKVNELLTKMISDIKKEIDESEKLREESKVLFDNAQSKLDKASEESKKILDNAKKETELLEIEMNDKFYKSSEIKKSLVQTKIKQMKEQAIKDIKDVSINIAVESVKKIITTSIDKSKLNNIFHKNLEEAKKELKKINSQVNS